MKNHTALGENDMKKRITVLSILTALVISACGEALEYTPGTPEGNIWLENPLGGTNIMIHCPYVAYADTIEIHCQSPASGGFQFFMQNGGNSPLSYSIAKASLASFDIDNYSGSGSGTFSLQVRGRNSFGTGGWSNTVSVSLP